MFHLISLIDPTGEAAVGARGTTGHVYGGHVFWDADVFVLPFAAATYPQAARAMLRYRARRLSAARVYATEYGYAGARFPWESAATGEEVAPRELVDHRGKGVEVRTGALEEHVTADVGGGARRARATQGGRAGGGRGAAGEDRGGGGGGGAAPPSPAGTGDEASARGDGMAILGEPARCWQPRAGRAGDAPCHIRDVIGP